MLHICQISSKRLDGDSNKFKTRIIYNKNGYNIIKVKFKNSIKSSMTFLLKDYANNKT